MYAKKEVDSHIVSEIKSNTLLSQLMKYYGAIIAGGMAHSFARGYSISKHMQLAPYSDIDLYFRSEKQYTAAVDFVQRIQKNRADSVLKSRTRFQVEKSVTGMCHNIHFSDGLIEKIQLVGCVFGTPAEIVDTFDFKNLASFCFVKEGKYFLVKSREAFKLKDKLDIRHSRSPFLMHRVYKYIKYRGYTGVTESSRQHLSDWIIKASSGYYLENTDGCPRIYVDLLDNSYVRSFLKEPSIISDEDLVYMLGKIKEDTFKESKFIDHRGYLQSTFVPDQKIDLVIEEMKRREKNANKKEIS